MTFDFGTVLLALVGGILPAVFWLMFWLRESRLHPEPKRLLIRTFILGMCAVILVIPFQKIADDYFPGFGLSAILIWAILEEGFKFGAAYFGGLRESVSSRPMDAMIYMITAALGFVALENVLFIINPLLQQDLVGGVLTGTFRFIGASLLHIVSSSMIGAGIALSYYKSREIQIEDFLIGFCLAIITHSLFNLFIINQPGYNIFRTFGVLWIGVALLLLFFEKVKRIKPDRL